ncbi:MAG: type II toxin-antitoxin system HicB family antitoxin [Rhodospirillaceae bacterium]|nr:type II toxin-antitoxin system HicB family antitoxin [Rhodospirillaceae bacterium]
MPRRLYPAIVHSDDGKTFGVSFVDFPVHAGGNSVEAAIADAEIVIAEVVNSLVQTKTPIPQPTAIAEIPAADREGAELVSLVPVHLPGKSRVISVTLDEELVARIDAVAPNRSGFLAEAARARLGGG